MTAERTTTAGNLPEPYFESDDRRFRLYHGNCLSLLPLMPDGAFDVIFADPPYFLSNDGITCHAGKMVSVNKGKWDKSKGPEVDHEFCLQWLGQCRRLLKPTGSIWVSGTMHIIHSVGYAMQCLGFKILNDITWVKPNPPPNLSCRYFTHATETLLWARPSEKSRHKFNYQLMKRVNGGKQMKSVWHIPAPRREEKVFGKHPTQKPVALLERIIAASSDENDLVLDPFSGSATTGIAAARSGRLFAGIDLDQNFLNLATQRFIGVPQADSPERILSVVTAHAQGRADPATLSSELRITKRQVRYYRQAAALLGLLSREAGKWALTDTGQAMSQSPPQDQRAVLARAILENPLVRLCGSVLRRRRGHGGPRQVIARLLAQCTALADCTCTRRAGTLLSWIDWAKEVVDEKQETLFRHVATTA